MSNEVGDLPMVSVGRGALTLGRPANTNRTLVLCFYGTGDKFDPDVRKPSLALHPHRAPCRIIIESERRAVHIAAGERQQTRADGLLSRTLVGTPVWQGADMWYGRPE